MAQELSTYTKPVVEPVDWNGTARYEVLSCLGKGGMGVVYEAFDREGAQTVALKRLRQFSPAALYLFKQEFRTLVDVQHPNLVRLYELVATDAHEAFFTMELVRGTDFLEHIRRPSGVDFDRLRSALAQLVGGVQALHAAGKLHRDIKPSNVLVTTEARVVLLDFGVATQFSGVAGEELYEEQPIVGTASYVAPEQASSAAATPASDWYSVGAILFEALVGRPPHVGSVMEVIRQKGISDAPSPAQCAEGVPADLDALCKALLCRTPDARPTGVEILRRLGVASSGHVAVSPIPSAAPHGAAGLIGRKKHVRALRDAFEATRAGSTVTVHLGGPSGMGKSSLMQEFVDDLARRGEAVVLRGRAYERESVPYKAIDSWVDALSRHLLRLSDRGKQAALSPDIWTLARLFPVLRRVPEIADVRAQIDADPHRLRRRAVVALRELLASLSQQQPVVVSIDDAHWGDADSAALLVDLVRPPHAPPFLLLMTHREDEAQSSAFLVEMRARWPRGADARDLVVGPLDAEDARRFAQALLGSEDERSRAAALAVARESHGSPFLVEELVRSHHGRSRPEASLVLLTLEQLVGERLDRLTRGPRALAEIVAVSGRPLRVSTAAAAAEVVENIDDALEPLRTHRLVRAGLRDGHEVVEIRHNRIREAIVTRLPADLVRAHHRRLARVLESTPGADPEAVVAHLLGAGETERAAPYAERAAGQAIAQLAFDRAVQLLRTALEGTAATSPNAHRLRVRLGEVLEWAGRSADAARVYVEAAEEAPPSERLNLQRAAAEQLLAAGRIDEGTVAIHRVLAEVGIKTAGSRLGALFWLIVYRLWAGAMSLQIKERVADEVRPEDRRRIDAVHAAALGLAVVDLLTAAYMKARNLIEALRAGDGQQIANAAVLLASDLACKGGPEGNRERALMSLAKRLADGSGKPEGPALFHSTNGACLMLRGRWRQALAECDGAYAKYPNNRAGWQANGNLWAAYSLVYLGDFRELTRRLGHLLADAEQRGDLYTSVNLRASHPILAWLVADDPETARRQVREAMAQWSQSGFLLQQWHAMVAEAEIELYVGAGARAYERIEREERALQKSLMLDVQFIRAIHTFLRGRCALASLDAVPTKRRARLAEAQRMLRGLERERMEWISVLAAILSAGVAHATGDRPGAITALNLAIERAEAASMSMYAASARYQLGSILGGEKGTGLVTQALEAMRVQEVRAPARFAAMLVPITQFSPHEAHDHRTNWQLH